ncbi:MAG: Uma2 family endonuclease [Leptolyngbyaceae cyanobacterium CSU_1_3]|nr:Uma2 family endonuclease [Leptolyngbyaceae cyanobacterium CSU_1_3]
MYDLPSEDPQEPGLPDEFHDLQPQLLSRTLRLSRYTSDRYFTGTDLNLYYDVNHTQWHKRPDWFLVLDVPRLYDGVDLRSSYVVWQEGVNPFVVVELLSPGTEKEDLGENAALAATSANGQPTQEQPPRKWDVYEKILRVPYYLVFSRYTNQLRCFHLVGGHYQEQRLDAGHPWFWVEELDLGLGVWQGEFEGITRSWLRWCDRQGNWISTDTEQEQQRAEQEQQRAEQEQQRAEQEQQRAEQAEAQLRQVVLNLLQSGMSIEQISQLTGLPEKQVRQLTGS